MDNYYNVLTEEEANKMELLYEKGYSIEQISDKTMFSATVIISLLKHRALIK